jgi:7-cyano-7-deazaguanine synthase in queuosine biosynthesis
MAIAKSKGYEIYSLSFRYGQRHAAELEASKRVAKAVGAKKHLVIDIDLRRIGGSALTDDIEVPKAQIIQQGIALGVDYALTFSCYDPMDGLACGRCDSCLLRQKGFEEAGIADPIRYANQF